MPCPHCAASATAEQRRRTALGYHTFRCRACRRVFNERTGTAYNHLQYPTDLVLLVVLWRLRYKLSLRDLAEMFLARGFVFSHETVRDWEARFAPLLTDRLRAKRRGQGGAKWHADETYVGVDGRWRYLYRAIDREGTSSTRCSASDATWTRRSGSSLRPWMSSATPPNRSRPTGMTPTPVPSARP